MAKPNYKAIIDQARKPENQNASLPDNQTESDPVAEEPETQPSGNPKNQKTRMPESQNTGKSKAKKTRKPENQNAGLPEDEEMVNLSIKVPLSLRIHWVTQAKLQRTSITALVMEALEERLGKPNS